MAKRRYVEVEGERLRLPRGMRRIGESYYSDFQVGGRTYYRSWGTVFAVARRGHNELRELAERHLRGMRDNGVRLGTLQDMYLAYLAVYRRPGTVATARFRLAASFSFWSRDAKVDQLEPGQVADYIRHRRAASIADTTINGELRAFAAMLNWARRTYTQSNPLADAELVKRPHVREHRVLEFDAWAAFATHKHGGKPKKSKTAPASVISESPAFPQAHAPARPCRWMALWLFLVRTGLRIGEAAALRWADIDLAAGIVRVEPHGEWVPKTKKGARAIPLASELRPALAARAFGATPDSPVFPEAKHQNNVRRALRRCLELAGLSELKLTPHDLRKTFCSWLASSGVPVRTAKDLMGHEDIRTTMNVYAQVLDTDAARAIEMVDRIRKERETRASENAAKSINA